MPEEYNGITWLIVLNTDGRVRLLIEGISKICARAPKAFPKLQWVPMNALLYQTQGLSGRKKGRTVKRQGSYGTSVGIRNSVR